MKMRSFVKLSGFWVSTPDHLGRVGIYRTSPATGAVPFVRAFDDAGAERITSRLGRLLDTLVPVAECGRKSGAEAGEDIFFVCPNPDCGEPIIVEVVACGRLVMGDEGRWRMGGGVGEEVEVRVSCPLCGVVEFDRQTDDELYEDVKESM